MIVSLNRWEWNRALFFGLIVVIAEIGLATGLVLRRLTRMEYSRTADRAVSDVLRDTRPPAPDRFAWLKRSVEQNNVFITFLVGGGVLISGVAWVVDRVASKTSTPVGEQRLRTCAHPDQLSARRLAPRRHHRPRARRARCRRRPDPQALAARRSRDMTTAIRLVLVVVGLAIGVVRGDRVARRHVVDPRADRSRLADRVGGRRAQQETPKEVRRSARWCRRRCSPAASK